MPEFRLRRHIEAMQFTGDNVDKFGEWTGLHGSYDPEDGTWAILGPGYMLVSPGDWLAKDAAGRLTRHFDADFRATYEPIGGGENG